MALTLTTIPAINFIENPLTVQLVTDAYRTTLGVKAVYTITQSSGMSAGDYFEFSWDDGNEVVRFNCVASPALATDFRERGGAETISAYIYAVIWPLLKSNFEVSRDFEVTYLNETFTLTAREAGVKYDLTFTSYSGYVTVTSHIHGIDEVLVENYHCVIEVLEDVSAVYTKRAEFGDMPDASNVIKFGLGCLDSLLTNDLPFTGNSYTAADVAFSKVTNSIKTIMLKYYEVSGIPAVYGKVLYSPVFKIMDGGLNHIKYPGSNLLSYLAASKMFLTWCPNNKYVKTDQPEYLGFLLTVSATELHLKVKLYFTDGATGIFTISSITSAVAQYNKYIMPAGYTSLGIAALYPSKTVSYYQVYITNHESTNVSEVRTYYVDRETTLNSKYIAFKNSLGHYDTLHCTGDFVLNRRILRGNAESMLADNYTLQDREQVSYSLISEHPGVLYSGYKTDAENKWLDELRFSKDVWLLYEGIWLPISITVDEMPVENTASDLKALEISFQMAFTDTLYTPITADLD